MYETKDDSKLNKRRNELFEYKDFFKSIYSSTNFAKLNLEYTKNQYSFYRTSKIEVQPFRHQVYIDNIKQNNPTHFVSKFHLSGSLTPLKSLVFPSLGSKALRFDKASKTHKALAITSLVLSAISFTVSEVFYQDYRRNINAEPLSMKYDVANSLHKVGLVSLGIYPVISISDILSCYIKCKNDGIQLAGNKRIQRQVNKEINDNRRKNIYLCQD